LYQIIIQLNNKESNFDVLTILNRIKLIKCVVIHFWPRKKIKKIKNKKNPKYKRIYMKKAYKIALVSGEGPKWQVKKLEDQNVYD